VQKDFYVFPCVFVYKLEYIDVYFPDLEECYARGENEEMALVNAKEVLNAVIYQLEQIGGEIPKPTKLKDIEVKDWERAVLIEVFMPIFRAKQENKYIRKNLTIPHWLNIEAERSGVNFSQVLQNGLKEYLRIKTPS